jgi:hypothetical protein
MRKYASPYAAIPRPTKNLKSNWAILPYIISELLGIAKIKKKASFFSKKPGEGWW